MHGCIYHEILSIDSEVAMNSQHQEDETAEIPLLGRAAGAGAGEPDRGDHALTSDEAVAQPHAVLSGRLCLDSDGGLR